MTSSIVKSEAFEQGDSDHHSKQTTHTKCPGHEKIITKTLAGKSRGIPYQESLEISIFLFCSGKFLAIDVKFNLWTPLMP